MKNHSDFVSTSKFESSEFTFAVGFLLCLLVGSRQEKPIKLSLEHSKHYSLSRAKHGKYFFAALSPFTLQIAHLIISNPSSFLSICILACWLACPTCSPVQRNRVQSCCVICWVIYVRKQTNPPKNNMGLIQRKQMQRMISNLSKHKRATESVVVCQW